MDAAGLAIGVVTLWQTCVQLYEVVNLARQYGMDYEILSVKLEVERVRLLSWGDAVGLSDATMNADNRFGRIEVHNAVIRLLGCIQYVFENSERLQNVYGLRSSVAEPEERSTSAGEQQSQGQLVLGGIFKRAHENLRRVALARQRNTPVIRKSKWAVHDRKKFMMLVAELRGFNDSLESLFPGAKLRIMEAMRRDIDEAVQVRDLQLLQEATAGEQGLEDISETASIRIEVLGATESARTELLSNSTRSNMRVIMDRRDDGDELETVKDADEGVLRDDWLDHERTSSAVREPEPELSKQLEDIDLYIQKKSVGALRFRCTEPPVPLAHRSAHVHWDGGELYYDTQGPWADKGKGFVPMLHASFDLYKRKKYKKKPDGETHTLDSEDYVLLDPESHIKFENVNPGTVTVEGFGLECWDFEDHKPRLNPLVLNHFDLPEPPPRRLLRRINEIQINPFKFGMYSYEEELNLEQFLYTPGTYLKPTYKRPQDDWIEDLYGALNRPDIFVDFSAKSSIIMQFIAPPSDISIDGIWVSLHQIILAWELAVRLKRFDGNEPRGLTTSVLASLIVSDLWLKHVKISLTDEPVDLKKPRTATEKAQAEEFEKMGDEARKRGKYKLASDLYTNAIGVDSTSAVYRSKRAAAQLALENWMNAERDAFIATKLDPKYAQAWSQLGIARLKLGNGKQAKSAYEKALLRFTDEDTTAEMLQGLVDANAKIDETVNAILAEKDRVKEHAMRSDFADEDFEPFGMIPEFHSLIYEQQVEGLILFAEKMKWPYINEVRNYAEDVYSEFRGGERIDSHLLDWLFGIVLPGKWDMLSVAHYYDSGLSLPRRSYWRSRTVLGRVLGCIPGVQGLCGWIGPCPPVEFDPLPGNSKKPRNVRISARRISPLNHKANINDHDRIHEIDSRDQPTDIQLDEEINPYVAEIRDSSQWIVPEPPVHDISTCHLQSIKLRKLPLDAEFANRAANDTQEPIIENETEWRASLEFTMDDNPSRPMIYKLLTNPVFVTPPPCRPGPKGPHEVHMRELPRYQKNIWSIEQLKDHTHGDDSDSENGDVVIINATGKGSEVLARAWCSERGRNAVIRRAGGPCFVCAVRAAGKGGLGLGTLIWVG